MSVNVSPSRLPPAYEEQKADVDDLAEIFHENTKYWPSTIAAATENILGFLHDPELIARGARGYNRFPLCRRIPLASAPEGAQTLAAAMRARRSTRAFSAEPLALDAIGGVLDLACRATRVATTSTGERLFLRSYPSGGALYPIEVYLVALSVKGVAPGVSHYDPRTHALEILREASDPAAFRATLATPGESENAAAVLVLTSVLQRSTAKYGTRGYRFALLEAGHCGQNICLAAAAANLGSCLNGGYFDDKLAALCGADGVNEAVVSAIFLGHPEQDAPRD